MQLCCAAKGLVNHFDSNRTWIFDVESLYDRSQWYLVKADANAHASQQDLSAFDSSV